ncbi:MAG TPA: hypothetical protein PKW35_15385 [Nannocystaceae bacterium]|nr:hypothetical protein [Nannocystaceae bacterium]
MPKRVGECLAVNSRADVDQIRPIGKVLKDRVDPTCACFASRVWPFLRCVVLRALAPSHCLTISPSHHFTVSSDLTLIGALALG